MKTLKKIIVPFAAVIYMAAISSCNILGGVLSGIEEINNEAEEIASGKVFTVDKGVVTYNDGITFTFKDHGKTWKTEDEDEITIVIDDKLYFIEKETSSGYFYDYSEGYSGCPYIFWENLYKFGDRWGAEIKEGKATIAGKKCTVFTNEDGDQIAGWERVLFKDGDFEATSWSDKVPSDAFSVDKYELEEY